MNGKPVLQASVRGRDFMKEHFVSSDLVNTS